jgi:hypothetical protein
VLLLPRAVEGEAAREQIHVVSSLLIALLRWLIGHTRLSPIAGDLIYTERGVFHLACPLLILLYRNEPHIVQQVVSILLA